LPSSSLLLLSAVAAVLSPVALAWGADGHTLTGQIASALMSDATRASVTALLQDQDGDFGKAATWADRVKFTKGYYWSRNLHFVDSRDNPPQQCGFDQDRDCADGKCLTAAIANYTTRLSCRYSQAERGEATKFLMHFLGDLTQPLHVCYRMVGGNSAKITFDGKTKQGHETVNLHAIWDTNMIEKRIKTTYGNSLPSMLDHLVSTAQSSSDAASWTACLNAAQSTPLACAVSWASDSDALDCSAVWGMYDDNPKQDFGKAYYDASWPVIEQQLMKAGVRLAAWFEANLRDCSGGGDDSQSTPSAPAA